MDRLVRDIPLEEAVLVSKNQKLAEVMHIIHKKKVERVLVTSDDVPVGVVTIKDILSKLGMKKMRRVSPTSLAVSSLSSEKLIITKPDENLLKAAQRLNEEGINALPVVGDDGVCLGLLARRNIIYFLKNKHNASIKEVMLPYLGTINPSANLSQALQYIGRSPIRELIVMERLKPIAIIGEKEIALALFKLLSTDSIHHVEEVMKRLVVSDAMKRIHASVPLESNLASAIDTLQKEKVNTLPVIDKEQLAGLLTRDAIFRYLLLKEELA